MSPTLFSLGTSTLEIDRFVELLKGAGVKAVADVRTSPYSKQFPWFNQSDMSETLRENKIYYVFLGAELGGRPASPKLFRDGIADYSAMAKSTDFLTGIDRLLNGLKKHKIAMVCSERDPLHCHRCLLVGRHLKTRGIETQHIHSMGRQESQSEAEERLLLEENLVSDELLYPKEDRLAEAYLRRNLQVAFSESKSGAGNKWQKVR